MIVKAAKGLSFRIQNKIVSDTIEVSVTLNHDVQVKLDNGSLIGCKIAKKELPKESPKESPKADKKTEKQ